MPNGSDGARGIWQEHLLPYMAKMLAGLTIFFFVASFVQLVYLHSKIQQAPHIDIGELGFRDEEFPADRKFELRRMKIASVLEANIVERRYHQANVLLMSRVWARYLGFVTGMVLAMVGASFILGRLQGSMTEFDAKTAGQQITLRSASPGIVICVLGVILMITTIVTHHEIETRDIPVYFGEGVPDPRPDLDLQLPPE